jgi:hypothetical protein
LPFLKIKKPKRRKRRFIMNKNTKIKVKNRSTGSVGYTIPDMGNYARTFAAGETKDLPFEEIQKLAYVPGGEYLLQHYLVIDNIEARDEILGAVELEYNWSEADVKRVLLNGSLDELLDCLDFAPMGVIDLVKKLAVQLELNDIKKRKAIQEKTGLNVDSAVAINAETNETEPQTEAPARRAATTAASTETAAPARRYNVSQK